VLGLTSGHGGPYYEMLLDGGEIAAHLHQWEADEHAALGNRDDPSRGNGVLLWFWTDDFDGALTRVQGNDVTVLDGPLLNRTRGSGRSGSAAPRATSSWSSGPGPTS
jgi:hypothetical protein